MKINFRTVLLVFLFIKLCVLFTVLQETIESLSSNDHPRLFGTNDIYLFDLMLASVSGLSMLISSFLIVLFSIGHNRIRKPYAIIAFVINLIFVIPFFLSGVYLTFQDDHDLKLTPQISKSFETIFKFAEKYNQNVNTMVASLTIAPTNKGLKNPSKSKIKTVPATTSQPPKLSRVSPKLMKHFEVVEHIQKRYCCCGLSGASYYGFNNATTASKMSIPFTSKLEIRCPQNSLFKNSTCVDSHLRGCESRLKTVYPTRILIYSCIGTTFSVIYAIISPFIYSQFELDRRRARSKYIREWRHAIDHHVNDHRMWALRNAPQPSQQTDKLSPVSPAASSHKSQSSKSKKSTEKQEKS